MLYVILDLFLGPEGQKNALFRIAKYVNVISPDFCSYTEERLVNIFVLGEKIVFRDKLTLWLYFTFMWFTKKLIISIYREKKMIKKCERKLVKCIYS